MTAKCDAIFLFILFSIRFNNVLKKSMIKSKVNLSSTISVNTFVRLVKKQLRETISNPKTTPARNCRKVFPISVSMLSLAPKPTPSTSADELRTKVHARRLSQRHQLVVSDLSADAAVSVKNSSF